MANPEHLALVLDGDKNWNDWREQNREIRPDFAGADLQGKDLSVRNLINADFRGANLIGANLSDCHLNNADFEDVHAANAVLNGSSLEWLHAYRADLTDAILIGCNAPRSTFAMANLTRANLAQSHFETALFTYADFTEAYLSSTEFIRTQMQGACFARCTQGLTVFVDAALVGATGLDSCEHRSFNMIDFRTLINSAGTLPLAFLRGCGLPEGIIRQYLGHWDEFSFVRSVFISHASQDRPFTDRLVDALQELGVRCFYSHYDMRAGSPMRETFYDQVDANDFLICVISHDALSSDWVRDEVQHALAKEREHRRRLVLPLRIDDEVMSTRIGWGVTLRDDRHIEDFREWNNPLSFSAALHRLIEVLKLPRHRGS